MVSGARWHHLGRPLCDGAPHCDPQARGSSICSYITAVAPQSAPSRVTLEAGGSTRPGWARLGAALAAFQARLSRAKPRALGSCYPDTEGSPPAPGRAADPLGAQRPGRAEESASRPCCAREAAGGVSSGESSLGLFPAPLWGHLGIDPSRWTPLLPSALPSTESSTRERWGAAFSPSAQGCTTRSNTPAPGRSQSRTPPAPASQGQQGPALGQERQGWG